MRPCLNISMGEWQSVCFQDTHTHIHTRPTSADAFSETGTLKLKFHIFKQRKGENPSAK